MEFLETILSGTLCHRICNETMAIQPIAADLAAEPEAILAVYCAEKNVAIYGKQNGNKPIHSKMPLSEFANVPGMVNIAPGVLVRPEAVVAILGPRVAGRWVVRLVNDAELELENEDMVARAAQILDLTEVRVQKAINTHNTQPAAYINPRQIPFAEINSKQHGNVFFLGHPPGEPARVRIIADVPDALFDRIIEKGKLATVDGGFYFNPTRVMQVSYENDKKPLLATLHFNDTATLGHAYGTVEDIREMLDNYNGRHVTKLRHNGTKTAFVGNGRH